MTDAVFTVSRLTRAVKNALEGSLPFVWVRGQVSNCSRPSSGHVYFSLKDEDAILNAVWFKGQQKPAETFDPLTGEVFENGPRLSLAQTLANGQEVVCAGKLTVYPPRGAYQLVVELAQDAGQGRLQQEFERVKSALLAKGYFDRERKRLLPLNPVRVAVVTAKTGAAIRDFLRVSEERGAGCEIRIYPTQVQGAEAPEKIAAAMRLAAEDAWAEALVLIRGGGSLEDLWAFNTEIVADAVFSCPFPVLAGVGHEVDVTIADLVADVRAATPTHAAQMLWIEKRELAQSIDDGELRLEAAWRRFLALREDRLTSLRKALEWLSPDKTLLRWEDRLAAFSERLDRATLSGTERRLWGLHSLEQRLPLAFAQNVSTKERLLERAALSLEGLDPLRPLERGYVIARNEKGAFLRSVHAVKSGETLELILRDGTVPVRVEKHLKQSEQVP